MVRHLTLHQYDDDYAARPEVSGQDVALVIPAAVSYVLDVAETWLGWDGRPVFREGNAWTPHKAVRRVADHLLDHLAEIECRLAGMPTLPDQWHGRMVTTDADFGRFTEVDLDEAGSRLMRLAACYQARLGGLDPAVLDERPNDATWTIREVAHHVSHVTGYADLIGRLPSSGMLSRMLDNDVRDAPGYLGLRGYGCLLIRMARTNRDITGGKTRQTDKKTGVHLTNASAVAAWRERKTGCGTTSSRRSWTMGWRMTQVVGEFLATAGGFLHADRARNTVLLTVSESLRLTGAVPRAGDELPLLGWWRSESGAVEAAFLHTPPFPVLLSTMTEEAATALAAQLTADGHAVAGVTGEERNATAFADTWRDRHPGTDVQVLRGMRLFRLGQLTWPDPRPPGRPRLAASHDRDLLVSWFGAFSRDVDEPEIDHGPAVDDRLSYDGLTIWEADGQPVSVAGVTRTVAGMIRVGPVYTPPELRGKGYAGGVTSAVSQAALDAGTEDVLLYTDLANPTSNALYQRLGYRAVEDRVVLSFG